MFGTWKYGRGQGQVENLKTSHDYETARSNQHQACNRCHVKKNRKSDPHSAGSSRSGRDGSGSPKGSHKSHSSKSRDRRVAPLSGISRDSAAAGGNVYQGGSVPAGHGMTTFDGYPFMSSIMEAQTSGYPATAPIGDFAAVGDYTRGTWMLDGSTSTAGIVSSFIATSEAMYTDDAHAFSNYSHHTSFDMYQHMGPNEDPRFWPQNQDQH
ncbi:hypothetical protein X797_004670 [Metarhizium robertsii]|uniref:Uncharacterized protein n=2 Tax=Metarhizium robertsii TaxID=568076 RepID=E9EMU1_METRA|nr:uncharacterized protein MAA_00359 [Metarhizium robertsii ARSEF 23]EFZ03285.1 hypothetical protein MAA_00359 [Metarhizium robertsii ARSEF 23]EXV02538.1 hypothetical protein X797_004670 [Metarhizium robertsii]